MDVKNIFAPGPAFGAGEASEVLLDHGAARIERIVSHSHASPPGFWYDQDGDEWVVVLCGDATLEFEGGDLVALKSGDYLTIPRGVKHRVRETAPETLWLAVHLK